MRRTTALLIIGFSCSSVAYTQVKGNTGAFTSSIPIEVPGFRGLEPSLALVYSSSSGNGTAGAGWSLTGFPTITRQGAQEGAPAYDATDTYRLGGRNLRECGASSSPGCLAGGTHFTEYENYQRIAYDGGSNTWTIDSGGGRTSVYTSVFEVGVETYPWGLSSVTDTLGNTVTYDWWCDGSENCYPDAVSYNGYRIKLHYRDDRPDTVMFGTGGSLGRMGQLLRSVLVELDGGAPIRAYVLSYDAPSSSTGRSLLLP